MVFEREQRALVAAGRSAGSRLSRLVIGSVNRLPEAVRAELRSASSRLTKVRSLEDATEFLTREVEHLLTVVAPAFVAHPLPVGRQSGRVLVGLSAGGAALLEEFDAVATIVSAGATAPSAPVVLAADFAALVLEAYVAASVRVHDLVRAGLPVVPSEVAHDLAGVMTGSSSGDVGPDFAAQIAKRVLRRWALGVTPLVGIAYDGWDAQKTVDAMSRLPLTARGQTPNRWE